MQEPLGTKAIWSRVVGSAFFWGVLLLTVVSASPAEEQPDPWGPYRFLVGHWNGRIGGNLGTGAGERTYEFVVGDIYLMSRHSSHRPPQPESPKGDVHEEIGIFSFDRERNVIVYRQFVAEGYVNTYRCETMDGANGFVCNTESVESGSGVRARWTVKRIAPSASEETSEEAFEDTFELGWPGKELQHLFTNRWTRAAGATR